MRSIAAFVKNAALGWLWPRFLKAGIGPLFFKIKNYLVGPIAMLLERGNRPYPKKMQLKTLRNVAIDLTYSRILKLQL